MNKLERFGNEFKRGQWKRTLKFFKGNVKRTLNHITLDLENQLERAKIKTRRDIAFFNQLAKDAKVEQGEQK